MVVAGVARTPIGGLGRSGFWAFGFWEKACGFVGFIEFICKF